VLAGVYVLAEALDLRLTTAIFRGFFAISVVIIVVLFQEELRQLFERLGVWSMRRGRRAGPPRSLPADILVETLTDLARQHIGALIVLPGRQPVVRHVRGGLVLDGLLSAPLLKSIFDPHSPGHDGAVIIEGDRVARFAAHLPYPPTSPPWRGWERGTAPRSAWPSRADAGRRMRRRTVQRNLHRSRLRRTWCSWG
jgi:diadenylate cyclase